MTGGLGAWQHRLVSARGPLGVAARGALDVAASIYGAAVRRRNRGFDAGRGVHGLGRPTLSVGNLTTGGTGKTPVVAWLASELRTLDRRPAILTRGYGGRRPNTARQDPAEPGLAQPDPAQPDPTRGDLARGDLARYDLTRHDLTRLGIAGADLADEPALLAALLNPGSSLSSATPGTHKPHPPVIPIMINPDRVAGAADVLRQDPSIDTLLLDDGFQHRRAHRDIDLVLISALDPFGDNHLLPRGRLREPLDALGRATLVLVTHASRAAPQVMASIHAALRRHADHAPVFLCDHTPDGLRTPAAQPGDPPNQPLAAIRSRRVVAFAGLGSTTAFENTLREAGADVAQVVRLADHARLDHIPRPLAQAIAQHRPELLITTEKDWVKLAPLLAGQPGAMAGQSPHGLEQPPGVEQRVGIEQRVGEHQVAGGQRLGAEPVSRAPAGGSAVSAELRDLPPVWRLGLKLTFHDDDGPRLLAEIVSRLDQAALRIQAATKR